MIGMASVYDSGKHTIIGGEIGAFIQRISAEAHRKLFVVRYEMVGSFCIAEWLSPNKDVFVDTMNLGDSLGNFTRKKADELRKRLFRPVTADETSRFVAENESQYHHGMADDNAAEWEREERIARGE